MALPTGLPSSITSALTDVHDPQFVIDDIEFGSNLQFPSDLVENEKFFMQIKRFEYKRGRQNQRNVADHIETIFLPMVAGTTSNYGMQYNDFSGSLISQVAMNAVNEYTSAIKSGNGDESRAAGKNLLKGLAGAGATAGDNILRTIAPNLAAEVSSQLGIVQNPRQETTFHGPSLRNHAFQFQLIPRNLDESKVINRIIKNFKLAMHPTNSALTGFFGFPDEFVINFIGVVGGKSLSIFPPISDCVLTDMNVTFNSHGQSKFFKSGGAGLLDVEAHPTEVTMALSFKEMNLHSRESIKALEYPE